MACDLQLSDLGINYDAVMEVSYPAVWDDVELLAHGTKDYF